MRQILTYICLGQPALNQTNLHHMWYIKWSHVIIFQNSVEVSMNAQFILWPSELYMVVLLGIYVEPWRWKWYVPLNAAIYQTKQWHNLDDHNMLHCSAERTWSQTIINHTMQTFNYAVTKPTLVAACGFISSPRAVLWRVIIWTLFALVLVFFGSHVFLSLVLRDMMAADNFLYRVTLASHVLVFVDILCPEDGCRRLLCNISNRSQNMALYPWWLTFRCRILV
jgi:hypothetical protein